MPIHPSGHTVVRRVDLDKRVLDRDRTTADVVSGYSKPSDGPPILTLTAV